MRERLRNDLFWCRRIQALIQKHATPPRTRGKFKGHASVDETKWLADLAIELRAYIRKRNRGIAYDNNLAIASLMGRVLAVWYCACHRAKSFDSRRPLTRKLANKAVTRYRGLLMQNCASDELMFRIFSGQPWNLPYGKNAIGGTFI